MIAGPTFAKKESLAMKGIAIIMMLLFHCFREKVVYDGFEVSFFPFPENSIVNIAYACKVCVSIFAFISGYGLFKNYTSKTIGGEKWVLLRYIKTFSGYWFVWVLCAVVFQIADGRYVNTYGKGAAGVTYALIDLCGLSTIFRTNTLNANWWYMSAAFVFIMLAPVVYKCKDYIGLIIVSEMVFIRILPIDPFPGHNSVYAFLTAFLCGCLFAKTDFLDRWILIGSKNRLTKAYKCLAEIWVLIALYKGYLFLPIEKLWDYHYGLFPVMIVLFSVEFIIPYSKRILAFLGKHSANIYMTHTFIRLYYFREFTYSWKHFVLILLVLLSISLCISVIVEMLKKALKYNILISEIVKRVEDSQIK